MPTTMAPSKQWTLRLKNHTRTVLLFADPAQTLISLKENLLQALENAPVADPLAPSAKKQQISVPASASDIELAKPIDVYDLSQGWQLIGDDEGEQDELVESRTKSKGKGKARVNGASGGDGGGGDQKSLSAWAIKENHVLAWRVKSAKSAKREEEEDETMGDQGDSAGWDVVVPTYDDTYADENALPESKD